MIFTSVPAVAMKSLFGMCDCTVDSDDGKGDFVLVLGILNACGHVHVRSHMSPGMDCAKFPSAAELTVKKHLANVKGVLDAMTKIVD